jgi:hypothetical protein
LHKEYSVTGPERREVEWFNMAVYRDEDTQRQNISGAIDRSLPEVPTWCSTVLLFRERKEWFVKRIQLSYKNCNLNIII